MSLLNNADTFIKRIVCGFMFGIKHSGCGIMYENSLNQHLVAKTVHALLSYNERKSPIQPGLIWAKSKHVSSCFRSANHLRQDIRTHVVNMPFRNFSQQLSWKLGFCKLLNKEQFSLALGYSKPLVCVSGLGQRIQFLCVKAFRLRIYFSVAVTCQTFKADHIYRYWIHIYHCPNSHANIK